VGPLGGADLPAGHPLAEAARPPIPGQCIACGIPVYSANFRWYSLTDPGGWHAELAFGTCTVAAGETRTRGELAIASPTLYRTATGAPPSSLCCAQISARLDETEADRRLRVMRPDAPRRLAEGAGCRVSPVHLSDAEVGGRPARPALPWRRAPAQRLRHRQRRPPAADTRRRKTSASLFSL